MNILLEVCLVASLAAAAGAEQLQVGIHVELPVTSNAVALPGADQADALVVTIAEHGQIYVGAAAVGTAEVLERALSGDKGKTLYLKGDARTPYGKTMEVLRALRVAGFRKIGLLTAQRESPEPGKLVVPKGLEVLLGARAPAGAPSAGVELLQPSEGRPVVKIDNQPVPRGALASTLPHALSARKAAVVTAEAAVPFGDVVAVLDLCRATGAMVVLRTPKP